MSVLLSWGHISFKGETELYDTLRFFLQALSEPWLYLAKRQRKADQTEEGALFYMTIGLHLVACKDELWEEKNQKTKNLAFWRNQEMEENGPDTGLCY